jgi:hypothetical protein
MAGLIISVQITYKDIAGLCSVDSLMDGQIVSRLAFHGYGTAKHVPRQIDRLDAAGHHTLSRHVIIVVRNISGGQFGELFLPAFSETLCGNCAEQQSAKKL